MGSVAWTSGHLSGDGVGADGWQLNIPGGGGGDSMRADMAFPAAWLSKHTESEMN